MAKTTKPNQEPILARNRRANFEYKITEVFEAGLGLTGTEVKALRNGRVQLTDGYVRVKNGQAWLEQVHIGEYEQGNTQNHDPLRTRRLLLHRREIDYLAAQVQLQGLTLIPMRLYTKHNRIKLEFGLGKGKKLWDKRQTIAKRDAQREADKAMSHKR